MQPSAVADALSIATMASAVPISDGRHDSVLRLGVVQMSGSSWRFFMLTLVLTVVHVATFLGQGGWHAGAKRPGHHLRSDNFGE